MKGKSVEVATSPLRVDSSPGAMPVATEAGVFLPGNSVPDTQLSHWQRIRFVLVLGALTALGPFTVALYLPALPTITDEFGVSETAVQFTLAGTLAGLAFGQLVIGPLSDIYGRRSPIIAGTILHIGASSLCFFANTMAMLGILRLLQGFGAAATGVVALAVVRDLFRGHAAAVMISHLMLVIGLAPILAPSAGGFLMTLVPWRGMFIVLAAFGIVALALGVWAMPETLPRDLRRPPGIRNVMRTYSTLIRDQAFMLLTVAGGLIRVVQWSYIAGSSFIVQIHFGLDGLAYGLAFGSGAVALLIGSQANIALLTRWTPGQISLSALCVTTLGGIVLLVLAITETGGFLGFQIPVIAILAAIGLVNPNVPAIAMTGHGESAGGAAALLGFGQFLAAAAAAPLVAVLGNDSVAVAAVMTLASAAAFVSLQTAKRASQRSIRRE